MWNKDEVTGKADQAKGKMKEKIGFELVLPVFPVLQILEGMYVSSYHP